MTHQISVAYDGRSITAFCVGVLTGDECDELRAEAEAKFDLKPGHVLHPEKGETILKEARAVLMANMRMNNPNPVFQKVMSRMTACIRHVNRKYFHMRISYAKKNDMKHGCGFQYLKYSEPGDFFTMHQDWGHWSDLSHRRLTGLLQLSDPLDHHGADLQLNHMYMTTVPRAKGAMVVFPSFWYHGVTPLVTGERHWVAGWFTGNDPLL